MRLLIVTQRVDRKDPILGFFHGWLDHFSRICSTLTVVALGIGDHALAPSVKLLSLSAADAPSKLRTVVQFWRYIFSERNSYDAVFIHMNPIWVILGSPLWFVLRKPVFLWYESRGSRWYLPIAVFLSRAVFGVSKDGLPVLTSKRILTGHGIDTDTFCPDPSISRETGLLITAGRISLSKRIADLLSCVEQFPDCHFEIVGKALTRDDVILLDALRVQSGKAQLQDRIQWLEATQQELVPLLQKADIFLHASETGVDKAVLEAMAAGCIVVSSSSFFSKMLPTVCTSKQGELAHALRHVIALSMEEKLRLRGALRNIVVADHGLQRLIRVICQYMEKLSNIHATAHACH